MKANSTGPGGPLVSHQQHGHHHQPHQHHYRPLAESIAVSTRSIHAKLNKLIIARLPLALPPRANDPSNYVSGLLHIAPIYTTFEQLWRSILDSNPQHDSQNDQQPLVSSRIHVILQQLCLPELLRSDRLKADIASLTGWPRHVVEEQLKIIGQSGCLGGFTQHIKQAVESKPHVLVAYSYILYMALFAGGRFIRASLESCGEDFWQQVPSPIKPTEVRCQQTANLTERASGLGDEELFSNSYNPHAEHTMPLRFFHFKTTEDGEDLKREFKRRLIEMESNLTDSEKHQIIQESVAIFENMTALVQQLEELNLNMDQDNSKEIFSMINPTTARFRDSVAVAKERGVRSSSSGEKSMYSIIKRALGSWATNSTISITEINPHSQRDHPPVFDMAAVELCPALSKSMRFEKALPRPIHSTTSSADNGRSLNTCPTMASKRSNGMRIAAWFVVIVFGAVVTGAFMFGQRTKRLSE